MAASPTKQYLRQGSQNSPLATQSNDAPIDTLASNPRMLGLVIALRPMLRPEVLATMQKCFQLFDHNHDGYISREDFSSAVGTHPIWFDLSKNMDVNHDFVITDNEFINGLIHHSLCKPISMPALTGNGYNLVDALVEDINSGISALLNEIYAYMRDQQAPGW